MKMDKAKSKGRGRKAKAKELILEGLGVSSGVAIGSAHLRESGELKVIEYQVARNRVGAECKRFEAAVKKGQGQLAKLKDKSKSIHGAAAEELGFLLEAHMQMLSSTRLLKGVEERIRGAQQNAEAAVMAVITDIASSFEAMDDTYLRARAEEVREVGLRIVRSLSDQQLSDFSTLPLGSLIIAEAITPADTALMDPRRIGGFACELGGAEGHTAIMARSLGLPAVLGISGLLGAMTTGDAVIIDGTNGLVIINPSERRLSQYQQRQKALQREVRALAHLRTVDAETRDGARITLQANLELPREVDHATAAGAEGVGLLRTEFLYMNRDDLPGEEEQYQAISEIVRAMGGNSVTVRTLDVGGEKLASTLGGELSGAVNPDLGLRAIRLALKERKLLETQLGRDPARRGPRPSPDSSAVDHHRRRGARSAQELEARDPPTETAQGRDRRSDSTLGCDDRGARRRAGGRCPGPVIGLLCHRHQRPDNVYSGYRPRRRTGGAPLQPATSSGVALDPVLGRGRAPGSHTDLGVRRDGWRSALHGSASRARCARSFDELECIAEGQEPNPRT